MAGDQYVVLYECTSVPVYIFCVFIVCCYGIMNE